MVSFLSLIVSASVVELKPADGPVIQPAIDRLVADGADSYTVLRLAPGSYKEKISVPKGAPPFKILGTSPEDTVITFSDGADTKDSGGKELGTSRSATVTIESDGFAAENVSFENTRGKGTQAVAMSVGGDKAVFRNCRFSGWQDTLLVRKKRQFFDHCEVSGSVDFIFGDATAFFKECRIICRDQGYITAASTEEGDDFGFVFSKCVVTSTTEEQVHLGRPWRPHASVHFLECVLPANIRPEGWENWRNPENEKTARYYEWRSSGVGANPDGRVKWSSRLDDPEGRGVSRPWRVLSKWDPDAELSPERISRLPLAEQAAWWDYLSRSAEALKLSKQTLREEMVSAGLKAPLRPEDKGKELPDKRDQKWFRSQEAAPLVESVISFQTPTGAWSKSMDYSKGPREKGTHWSSQGGGEFPWHYVGTIDNGATVSEIRFLASFYHVSRNSAAKAAVEKGVDHLLRSQFPNGGWPQVWPLEGGYHDQITYNDDAMIHVLELMSDIARKREPFGFVNATLRESATEALKKGADCLLASQFKQAGKLSVWCAQHDPITLLPSGARMQEPASLSSYESVSILNFLMKEGPKNPQADAAINAGIAWFERSAIKGIRREEKDGRNHYAEGIDDGDHWWGRFHDLETNLPIFSGADDGRIYSNFADLFANNPTEYQYYTTAGRNFLSKDVPAWRAR